MHDSIELTKTRNFTYLYWHISAHCCQVPFFNNRVTNTFLLTTQLRHYKSQKWGTSANKKEDMKGTVLSSKIIRTNGAPGVDDHGMPIRSPLGVMCTRLRCGDDVTLRLDRPRAQQRLPVRLARLRGEGGRHQHHLRAGADDNRTAIRGKLFMLHLVTSAHRNQVFGRARSIRLNMVYSA